MAKGTRQGARGSTRRNSLPRVHSAEGVQARFDIRKAHVPATSDKFRDGFTVPGSRNPAKVGGEADMDPVTTLTEAQIEEAQKELKRREKERQDRYHREYDERQRAYDARFKAKMEAAYPGIDEDTRYSIYSDYRDHYE